jgi:hypothetical protein
MDADLYGYPHVVRKWVRASGTNIFFKKKEIKNLFHLIFLLVDVRVFKLYITPK